MHNIILHLSLYYPLPSSETEKRDGSIRPFFHFQEAAEVKITVYAI